MKKSELDEQVFEVVKVEAGDDFAATNAGWKWSRRCPVTGRFVSGETFFVTTDAVMEPAVEEWHNVDGESHSHSDCAGEGTVSSEPTGWLCSDCVALELFDPAWLLVPPPKVNKGRKVAALLTSLSVPMTAREVAAACDCTVGRVNEVKHELGLTTTGGFFLPAA